MRDSATIKAYHRRRLLAGLTSTAVFLAYAAVAARVAGPVADRLAGVVPGGRWPVLLLFATAFVAGFELLTLPLRYYRSFVLEHRFDLSTETPRHWLGQQAKGWLVGAIIGALMLTALYALLWHGGRQWWAWVWAAWMGLAVVLAQVFPLVILPLFYPTSPIEDAALADRLARLAEGTGIRLRGVFKLTLSDETKKANAMLTGLGATRRVFLSDTLLDSFTLPQIEVVFAHELGHHVRGHIFKGLALSAVASTGVVAAIAWQLDPFAGPAPDRWPAAVAALPAAILAAALVQLLYQPLYNAISRHFERQCDADALTRTANPDAYRQTFEKLGEMNLADPNPPRIIEILFYDHPAIAKRIARADE